MTKKPSTVTAAGIKLPVWSAHDVLLPLAEVKPDPENPNQHSDAQIDLYAKVIKSNGWRRSVVVSSRTGLVVKGHGALLAAARLGCDRVPVETQRYKGRAEEVADMIADNELAALSVRDEKSLGKLIEALRKDGTDTAGVGMTDERISDLLHGLRDGQKYENANDPNGEWRGMPECESEDLTAFKSLRVNFKTEAHLKKFADLVGQTVTLHTRSIWFPPAKIDRYADKRYTG